MGRAVFLPVYRRTQQFENKKRKQIVEGMRGISIKLKHPYVCLAWTVSVVVSVLCARVSYLAVVLTLSSVSDTCQRFLGRDSKLAGDGVVLRLVMFSHTKTFGYPCQNNLLCVVIIMEGGRITRVMATGTVMSWTFSMRRPSVVWTD